MTQYLVQFPCQATYIVQAFEKQNKVNNEDNECSKEFRYRFRGDFDMRLKPKVTYQ